MKNKYDVIVVGGGPAGSMAAIEISKAGYSVCILEKDKNVGLPVRCGEAIGYTGLNQFFRPKDSWIASEVNGAILISPNNHRINVDFKTETGYILNRSTFDYDISRIVIDNGGEVYTSAYVKDVIKIDGYASGVLFEHKGQEKKMYANIIIGADGLESRVGRWAGIKTIIRMKDMESCVQYSVENINLESKKMIMYIGEKYAPGGYLWIFPKGQNSANIGIGISGKYSKHRSAKSYIDQFIKDNYPEVSISNTVCGGVPCARPMKEPIGDGVMLVGDAAHQINPMTGGGIASGMKGGQIAGQVAVEALKSTNFSKLFLSKYPKRMFKNFGNNHNRFYRIKEAINQLSDNDLNYIAEKAYNIPQNKRSLMGIFKYAVYKKPSLVVDVLKVFAGV